MTSLAPVFPVTMTYLDVFCSVRETEKQRDRDRETETERQTARERERERERVVIHTITYGSYHAVSKTTPKNSPNKSQRTLK